MPTNEMGMGEGTLGRAAGLVREARQDLDRLSSLLEGQISGLSGRWAGAGGQAFFALHQAWTEKQHTLVGVLEGFAEALARTEQVAMGTDDAQAAGYARTMSRLG